MNTIIAARLRPKLVISAMPLEEDDGAGGPGELDEFVDDTLASGGSGGSTVSATSSGELGGFAGASAVGGI